MEMLFHDHNILRDELNSHVHHSEDKGPDFSHELNRIDAWEKDTLSQIERIIRAEAERARQVIHQITRDNQYLLFHKNASLLEELNRLKNLLTALGSRLQARMETMDYSELDLREWQAELKKISESSSAPQSQLSKIINKVSIKETTPIPINFLYMLDIVYVNEAGETITRHDPPNFDYTNVRYQSTLRLTRQALPDNHLFYFRHRLLD